MLSGKNQLKKEKGSRPHLPTQMSGDNGGRRVLPDRRVFSYSLYVPERRTKTRERRTETDRRGGLMTRRSGKERRSGTERRADGTRGRDRRRGFERRSGVDRRRNLKI